MSVRTEITMDSEALRKQLPHHAKTLHEIRTTTQHAIAQSQQLCDHADRLQEATRHIIMQTRQLLTESYDILRTQPPPTDTTTKP